MSPAGFRPAPAQPERATQPRIPAGRPRPCITAPTIESSNAWSTPLLHLRLCPSKWAFVTDLLVQRPENELACAQRTSTEEVLLAGYRRQNVVSPLPQAPTDRSGQGPNY